MHDTRKLVNLALLIAMGVALHVAEGMLALPLPVPGVKLGVADIVTLLALYRFGASAGMTVAVGRVLLGSLAGGLFLSPGFLLSLAGGAASTAAMALMAPGAWRLWSPLALSAAGAVAHGGAQLLALRGLHLLPSVDLSWLVPIVLAPALAAGIFTGLLGNLVLLRWQSYLRTAG